MEITFTKRTSLEKAKKLVDYLDSNNIEFNYILGKMHSDYGKDCCVLNTTWDGCTLIFKNTAFENLPIEYKDIVSEINEMK